jgi:hypothetical protein
MTALSAAGRLGTSTTRRASSVSTRVQPGAVDAVGAQPRLERDRLLAAEHTVAFLVGDPGQAVVGPQADAQLGIGRPVAGRHQHLHRAGEVRGDLAHRVALGGGLAHQADIALLQIAQAAVDELG